MGGGWGAAGHTGILDSGKYSGLWGLRKDTLLIMHKNRQKRRGGPGRVKVEKCSISETNATYFYSDPE